MDYQRNSPYNVIASANDAGDALWQRRIKLDNDSASEAGCDGLLFTADLRVSAVEVVFDCVVRYGLDLPGQEQR